MSLSSLRIYDPRQKQDFRINIPGETFSSLDHGFYVIDNSHGLNWAQRLDLLKLCVLQTSKLGFFTLVPWVPGARKLRAEIGRKLESVIEFQGTLGGYFDSESDSIERLFKIREEFGGNKSGEWGFGGCLAKFTPPIRSSLARTESWDFSHVLRQASLIGCFLYLGEMCQTVFMTKLFPALDAHLGQLPPEPP